MPNPLSPHVGYLDQRRTSFWRWSLLWLTLCLMTAQPSDVSAQTITPSTNPYARALAQAGDGQLDRALALLDDWSPTTTAEEEQRLWGRATLLRRLGRSDQALALLEELVTRRPDVARFRIALAEVLAERGQSDRARHHLEGSLGGATSDDEIRRATQLLASLETRPLLTGHFSLSLVPSTNAAQKTGARFVTLGDRRFILSDASRKRPAQGIRVQTRFNISPRIGPKTQLRFGLSGDAQIFDGRASDDIKLRSEIALRYEPRRALAVELGGSYAYRWIDGQAYSQAPGLFLGLTLLPDRQSRLQIAATLEDLSHQQAKGLDGHRSLAVLSYARAVTPQLQLRGSLGGERLAATDPSSAYSAVWAGAGASYFFKGGLQIGVDISLRHSAYDAASVLFGTRRSDRQIKAAVEAKHSAIELYGFAPVIGAEYSRRLSNIPVYSYDELRATLGLTRRF